LREIKRVCRKQSRIIITALKKTFQLTGFSKLLNEAGLSEIEIIKDEELKDWIALTIKNNE
jgi:hypothetical protein